MKRVTIYVDEQEWQGVMVFLLGESARLGKRLSAGSYLIGLHKGNKVYTSEQIEKIEKTQVHTQPKSSFPTGGVQFNPQPKGGK